MTALREAARGIEHTFRWSQTSFTELDFTGCTKYKYCEMYQTSCTCLKTMNIVFRSRLPFPFKGGFVSLLHHLSKDRQRRSASAQSAARSSEAVGKARAGHSARGQRRDARRVHSAASLGKSIHTRGRAHCGTAWPLRSTPGTRRRERRCGLRTTAPRRDRPQVLLDSARQRTRCRRRSRAEPGVSESAVAVTSHQQRHICVGEQQGQLRGFFSACYQPLLWQIFNFDDSASGWLQSVSNGREGRTAEREASMLLDFLSPTGPLMKAVLAADADGLMQFAFPLERLPVRTQRRLQTDPASLNQRLPYRNSVQRDSHGRFHVHLGLYHYFLFWSAYYACTEARGSSSSYDRRGRSSRRGLPYGSSSGRQWMAGLLGPSQRIQPYRELLLSHLQYFLPRGGNLGRDGSWGGVDYHRAGSVSQGDAGEHYDRVLASRRR